MAVRSALITVMVRAAEKAARSLRRDYGEVEHLQVSMKGPGDFVSAADRRAQEIIEAELAKSRPDFDFLGEETARPPFAPLSTGWRWIVDPLDGTTNFLHAMPLWCISIAAEQAGQVMAGLVYDVLRDELFWAERGVGAYVNSRRLRVSARRDLSQAVVAGDMPRLSQDELRVPFLAATTRVAAAVAGFRCLYCATLSMAWVAAGRLDGWWNNNAKPWDYAAGSLLVTEAGGVIDPLTPDPLPVPYAASLIATNQELARPLRALIRGQ